MTTTLIHTESTQSPSQAYVHGERAFVRWIRAPHPRLAAVGALMCAAGTLACLVLLGHDEVTLTPPVTVLLLALAPLLASLTPWLIGASRPYCDEGGDE